MAKVSRNDVTPPPLGRRYDIFGRRLLLHRSGVDGPAVVFLPGAGLIGLDYLNIHDAVARRTTSVIYDRAGTGWSDAVALPRTAASAGRRAATCCAQRTFRRPMCWSAIRSAAPMPAAMRSFSRTRWRVCCSSTRRTRATPRCRRRRRWPAHPAQGLAMVPALWTCRAGAAPRFEAMLASWPEPVRARLVDYHLAAWRKSLDEARNLQPEILDEIRLGEGPTRRPDDRAHRNGDRPVHGGLHAGALPARPEPLQGRLLQGGRRLGPARREPFVARRWPQHAAYRPAGRRHRGDRRPARRRYAGPGPSAGGKPVSPNRVARRAAKSRWAGDEWIWP